MANFSKGKIAIPSVTGNIVINIQAVQSAPSYTNLVPSSINADGTIYNTTGYKNGYRLNSSGSESAQAGSACTGFIPFSIGDVLRIGGEGVLWNHEDTTITTAIWGYDSNFNALATTVGAILNGYGKITKTNGVYSYRLGDNTEVISGSGNYTKITSSNVAYIRVSAVCSGQNLIITKNEPIV